MREPADGPLRPPNLLVRVVSLVAPPTKVNPLIELQLMLTMALIVGLANVAVLRPVNDWLTLGHFVFPFAFLLTDIANRLLGTAVARRIVLGGFLIAVVASFVAASPRVAVASGTAFLVGQWIDIWVFDRLRRLAWWRAPLVSSIAASAVDTTLFYSLAFAGTGGTWMLWGLTDLGVKLLMIPPLLGMFWFYTSFLIRRIWRSD